MSNELTLYDKIENPIQAAQELGKAFAASGMFGCEKVEQGTILALACMAERKTPFEIMRTYHLIGGKLAMRADAMLAAFRKLGGKVTWKQYDDAGAKAVFKMDENDLELSFLIEDAKRAGFIPAKPGSGWTKHPGAMMRARLISMAVRMLCPEAVAGTYTPEEVSDFEPTGPTLNLTPEPQPAPVTEAPKRGRPAKSPPPEKTVEATVVEPEEVIPIAEEAAPASPPANGNGKLEKVKALLKGKETQADKWFKKSDWREVMNDEAAPHLTVEKLDKRPDKVDQILARSEPFLHAIMQA